MYNTGFLWRKTIRAYYASQAVNKRKYEINVCWRFIIYFRRRRFSGSLSLCVRRVPFAAVDYFIVHSTSNWWCSSSLFVGVTFDAILHRIIMYCPFRNIFGVSWVATVVSVHWAVVSYNNMIVLLIFPASYVKVSFSLLILLFRFVFVL